MGGHGDHIDGMQPPFLLSQADLAGCFVAIHFRHLAIHQDDIVGNAIEGIQHLTTVSDDVGPITEFRQHFQSDFLIHEIVFSQQYSNRVRGGRAGCTCRRLNGEDFFRLRALENRNEGVTQAERFDRLG